MKRIIKSRIKECIDKVIKEEGLEKDFDSNPHINDEYRLYSFDANDCIKYLTINLTELPKVYIIQECEQSKVPEQNILSLLNKFAKKLERDVISPDDLYIIQLEDLYTKTDDICNKTKEIVRNLGKYPKFKPKESNLVFEIGHIGSTYNFPGCYDFVNIYLNNGLFVEKDVLFKAHREGYCKQKNNWEEQTYKPGDWEKKLEEFYKQTQPNVG